MFIKWGILLMLMSLMSFYSFFLSVSQKNLMIIEYFFSSLMNIDFKLYFLLDWISNLFIAIVLLISSLVIFYSDSYMGSDPNKYMFCWVVLLFVLSMILLILMPNMFMIILGWDGLGLVSYCLVIFYQSVKSYNSGMMTIISNRVGDVMMIMALIFFFNFGTFDILSNSNLEKICGIFLIVAGMTKSAQIPFSAWLPAAMAAPTPVSSLVHSSTLVTAGVYILIRFNYLFKMNEYSGLLLKVSLMTLVMAGISAFVEVDLKKIIAFSTLSQLSMMMISLSMGMTEIAFFHLIMHAIFKSMLFLSAGLMIHSLKGIQDVRMLSNFFSCSPLIISCMMISMLSLMGFPFIGGFYSKDLIVEFFFFKSKNLISSLMFIIGLFFTFLYCMRMVYLIGLKGIYSLNFFKMHFDKKMSFPIYILTMFLLIFGNFLFWLILLEYKIMFISKMSKLFSLFLLALMLYFSIFVFMIKKPKIFFPWSKFDFFYTMWNMSNLTSLFFLKKTSFFLQISMYDWKWMEMMGPIGLKKNFSNHSLISYWLNSQNMSNILLLTIIMMVTLI
uniref:NADH-ubiquinone oxidoreductase chain 5 n=1 Tax=Archaeocroton sphenodonti TaxID=2599316 RepID=H9M781_9ACAR|nr:NADH dehydrogenase subunit 5 [Archaeocroton sphenodonti]AET63098.1 NADH dehydrogenase subunit 5 [Archaeocroton sphenodonti]